jgi:copper chaperone
MENQTKTTEIVAPDIVCGGCAGAIKNALGKVNGVSQVEVDVETKTVKVSHGGEVSREEIVGVLDDAGFPTD